MEKVVMDHEKKDAIHGANLLTEAMDPAKAIHGVWLCLNKQYPT